MRTARAILTLLVVSAAGAPLPAQDAPASDAAPQTAQAPLAPPPPLVREGARLIDQPGLLRLSGDDWAFTTDHAGQRRTFILSPSLKLGELEQVAAARGEGQYRLSGRVYVYARRNYLLVESFASVGEGEQASQAESPVGGPSVADLIREFEQTRADRASQRRPGGAGSERRGEAIPLRREGTTLTMVRGKVLQNPAGWAYFEPLPKEGELVPGADAIPVAMMPSLLLEELEGLAAFSPEPPVITLSGEFFAHRGRNYLLPRMYLVERTPRDTDAALPPIANEVAR